MLPNTILAQDLRGVQDKVDALSQSLRDRFYPRIREHYELRQQFRLAEALHSADVNILRDDLKCSAKFIRDDFFAAGATEDDLINLDIVIAAEAGEIQVVTP